MTDIKSIITNLISSLQLTADHTVELEHPKNSEFGDYATNIALKVYGNLTGEEKAQLKITSPKELADYLANSLLESLEQQPQLKATIKEIKVDGPGFINFTLADDWLKRLPSLILNNSSFGETQLIKDQTWELEHTSPNPNKAMHLGHLRNNLTAMAIANFWEAIGVKVIRDAVDNNRGIAIAKLMWGYLKFAHKDDLQTADISYWFNHQHEWLTPTDLQLRPDKFVDQLYLRATTDCEQNQESEKQVRQMVVDWENQDEKVRALWAKVLEYSYQGQEFTLTRLGNQWDIIWREHEHYQLGKDLIQTGLKQGAFVQLEGGAVLSQLEKYSLPDTIVQKADGTSLYITQDIALTKLKKTKLQANKLFWVVGGEQSLALKQLFAICDQLGIAKYEELTHIAYGYMSIKGQGKMSSRTGNVIYIDDLIDAVKDQVKLIMKDSISEHENADALAEEIALGAVKYSILKNGRLTDTAFDFETALQLDGNSGPYLQYACTRAQSVLKKSGVSVDDLQGLSLSNHQLQEQERDLLRLIYQFPEIIQQAGLSYEPCILANFLYQLAQKFNTFYNSLPIINENESLSKSRLAITASFSQVMKKGLTILGITVPKTM